MTTRARALLLVAFVALAGSCTAADTGAPAGTAPPGSVATGVPATTAAPATATSSIAPTTTPTMVPAEDRATVATTTSVATTTPDPTATTLLPPPVTVDPPAPGSTGSLREIRPPADLAAPPLPESWTSESIGTSVRGRPIVAWSRPVVGPRRTVVVIGAVHGNEPASPPTVRALVDVPLPDDVEVWLVPELNPDGVAAGTRWNAAGVDLNRNFPWGWRADDGGPAPLSEPESRAAVELVERLRPDLVVWVHQPYGYVSSVAETDRRFEEAWSRGSGIPVRSGVTQHGGGESWAALEAGLASILVEVESWEATPAMIAAQRAGFAELIASLP